MHFSLHCGCDADTSRLTLAVLASTNWHAYQHAYLQTCNACTSEQVEVAFYHPPTYMLSPPQGDVTPEEAAAISAMYVNPVFKLPEDEHNQVISEAKQVGRRAKAR